MRSTPRRASAEEAELLAIAALTFLSEDPERLGRFLAETGLEPEGLRSAATTPGFLPAILDYLIGNEPLLLDFASFQSIDPAAVPAARAALPGARRDY
jgi:hypothetical protein